MSEVTSTTSVEHSNTFKALPSPDRIPLTGEALLIYCESKLNNLDSEINTRLGTQQESLENKKIYDQLQQVLTKYGPNPSVETIFQKVVPEWGAITKDLKAGSPISIRTAQLIADITKTHLNNAPSENQWNAYIMDLKGKSESIKSDSEINMIQIQQFMSQRQTAIQMVTNIMSKHQQTLEDQAKKIGG